MSVLTPNERRLVDGALEHVFWSLLYIWVGVHFIGWVLTGLLNPVDSTDGGRWDRSEMVIRTDALTGCEYLAGPNGGLTPRLDAQSQHIGCQP